MNGRETMTDTIKVPDIGDFKDVPIIEVYVKPGQTIAAEETLITLESDKAAMDVPAPSAGVIGEVRVKVGDRVSAGSVIATFVGADSGKAASRHPRLPSQRLPRLQMVICTPRCL
jgi:dihydrolipoyl dehydrogenase